MGKRKANARFEIDRQIFFRGGKAFADHQFCFEFPRIETRNSFSFFFAGLECQNVKGFPCLTDSERSKGRRKAPKAAGIWRIGNRTVATLSLTGNGAGLVPFSFPCFDVRANFHFIAKRLPVLVLHFSAIYRIFWEEERILGN